MINQEQANKLKNKSGIYKLIINKKIYIGSAINLKLRLRQHYNDLLANRHRNIHLQRAYNLYNKIDFDIIEIINDHKDLIIKEQFYIDKLNPDYNISRIAGSQLGFKHTNETKLKLSKIQIGKKLSEETRLKMSLSRKGVKFKDSHRKKLSESKKGSKNPFYKVGVNHPQYGTHRSMSTKLKISKAHSNSGVMYDVEKDVNYIFQHLKTICNHFNLNYRGVLGALRNNRFYKNRYYFDFVDIPENICTNLDLK